MRDWEKWSRVIAILASTGSIFAGLLYLIGRKYLESYYYSAGIPPSMLKFDWTDYLYAGAHSIGILLAFGFTLLAYHIMDRFWLPKEYSDRETTPPPKKEEVERKAVGNPRNIIERLKKQYWALIDRLDPAENRFLNQIRSTRTQEAFFLVYYALALAGGILLMCLLELLAEPIPNIGIALFFILLPVFFLVTAIMWLRDASVLSYIKGSNMMRNVILVSSLVILVLYPYLVGTGWGYFMGAWDTKEDHVSKVFDSITLVAKEPFLQDLQWTQNGNNSFQTTENLYLIAQNNGRLFVRPQGHGNETLVVPTDQLTSYGISFKSIWEWQPGTK